MSGAGEYDSVRVTTTVESVPGGRVVPVGAEGAVLDGSCLAEVALAPQTADDDGDFVQVVLGDGQYEAVRVHDQAQEASGMRPGPAFEGGRVVFVIGAGENRDGTRSRTCTRDRGNALPPYGQRDKRRETP